MTISRASQKPSSSTPTPVASSLLLTTATPGEHHSIRDFLVGIFRQPTAAEFQAQLDDPYYEPRDRLLVRHDSRIVAHVRLLERELRFGPIALPVTQLAELATAAEYRRRGLARALIGAAERRMTAEGSMLGLIRTRVPKLLARLGWTPIDSHSWSTAGTREILAYLSAREAPKPPVLDACLNPPRLPPLSTRIWRHVEQAALMRLYGERLDRSFGSPVRGDDYWRWLITRRGFDAIYVAVSGPDRWSLDERPIVGYAVVRGNRIVELRGALERPEAEEQLVARVCGDFIEQDWHHLQLDAAPDDPWHDRLVAAGGRRYHGDTANREVAMVRVLDHRVLLERLLPLISQRAVEASERVSVDELGLQWNDGKARLVVTRRGARLEPARYVRHAVTLDNATFSRLLLGQLHVPTARAAGEIRATTPLAAEWLAALFPRVPYWSPVWDDLPSQPEANL